MNNKPAITGVIKKFAIAQPNKIALIIHDVQYTYFELYKMINSAAHYLSQFGVGQGTHIVTVASPEIEYIACEYAILGLGAVNIPVENRIPAERLGQIACSVDAEMVISDIKPLCNAKWIPYEEIDLNKPQDYSWSPVSISNDCSEIIFTTGTTGKSKGVMLSSHCLETYLAAINPTFKMENDTVFLVTTPLNHVGGLHRIHQCMSVGCTAVLLDGIKDLRSFFHSINEYGVTHTYLPPASVKMLITLAKRELAGLNGKLQFIYTASAPFPMKDIETLMELLPATRLHQGYGSSETGSICNCQYNAPGKSINSLGKPYSCVDVFLEDETGNIISEPNKEGYIRSKSDMNMLGYYKEPELTSEVLKEGYIYSHDLLFFDNNGELHFAGRGDDVINIRGFKVAPIEVENSVLKHQAVNDCICIPYNEPGQGTVIKLLVQLNDDYSLDPNDLNDFISGMLEPYKMPKYIEEVPEIIKTANGKTNRKEMIRLYSNQ